MLIGLLSDTHIRLPGYRNNLGQLCANEFPPEITKAFEGVDLILHAGDVYSLPILDGLESVAPVLVSEGDDDPFEILNDRRCKWRQVINLDGVTIWLAHQQETWYWDGLEKAPDVIVFGHSHSVTLEDEGGILRVNPGSAMFPHYKRELGTVGLLTVGEGKPTAKIIPLQ